MKVIFIKEHEVDEFEEWDLGTVGTRQMGQS